jgi:hypothetical protein
MPLYSLSISGATYSGSTSFLNSSTTFSLVQRFSGSAALVASAPLDTAGTSGSGINVLDIAFLVGSPFAVAPAAGSLIWASNNALDDVFTSTKTGPGAVDEVTQSYDPGTRTLVTRLDPIIAPTTTLDYYTETGGLLGAPREIINGEVDITFSPDGRSLTGKATFFGTGYVEPTTSAWSATFSGIADPASASLDVRTLGLDSVFRFFDTSHGTHFFTGSVSEKDQILASRPDLKFEGTGMQAVGPSTTDANSAPVYRFFDKVYGTHFFTASASERDAVRATRPDLTFEGTGFNEHTAQQPGDVPVYRFFDTQFGTHFYTADAGERATILATRSDLRDEGIGFYAPTHT